jgi:hypothetical protein
MYLITMPGNCNPSGRISENFSGLAIDFAGGRIKATELRPPGEIKGEIKLNFNIYMK